MCDHIFLKNVSKISPDSQVDLSFKHYRKGRQDCQGSVLSFDEATVSLENRRNFPCFHFWDILELSRITKLNCLLKGWHRNSAPADSLIALGGKRSQPLLSLILLFHYLVYHYEISFDWRQCRCKCHTGILFFMIEADEEYMLLVKLLAWGYKRFGLSKLSWGCNITEW